jgi:hypothetical protein
MKRQLLGVLVAVVTFWGAFRLAPIRFVSTGVGNGLTWDLKNPCSFSTYSSTYFEKLSYWGCSFENKDRAREYFRATIAKYDPILVEESRTVVRFPTPDDRTGYCVFKLDGRFRREVCSLSLEHVLEFERQFLSP